MTASVAPQFQSLAILACQIAEAPTDEAANGMAPGLAPVLHGIAIAAPAPKPVLVPTRVGAPLDSQDPSGGAMPVGPAGGTNLGALGATAGAAAGAGTVVVGAPNAGETTGALTAASDAASAGSLGLSAEAMAALAQALQQAQFPDPGGDSWFPDPNKTILCTRKFRADASQLIAQIKGVDKGLAVANLAAAQHAALEKELQSLSLALANATQVFLKCVNAARFLS
jgi:hypothetical protein